MNIVTGFRVSDRVMARIPAVQEKLASDEKVIVLANVTRSVAMRMSILYGIERLNTRPIARGETLAGHPGVKALEPRSKHVSLTLPPWLLDRAQAIADKDPSGKTKRAHVLRNALDVGTKILQEEA